MSEHDGSQPPIAVAIVSWNTRDLLDRCLSSLRSDHEAGRATVWVVDNDSGDGSPDMVRSSHPWVTLVRAGTNLGFGAAVNLVAERTETPWLVAANADITLEPGSLEQLRRTAESRARIGLVGPRLLLLDGSTQISVQPFPGLRLSALFALHADRYSTRAARAMRTPDAWEPPSATPVPWIAGALVMMARAAFDDAGGFDPEQWLYGEDLDLCWRMREAGWSTVYEPRARVHHALSAATAQRFEPGSFDAHITATNFLWMLRRRGRVSTRLAATVATADALARVAVLGLGEQFDRERFGSRSRRARLAFRQNLDGFRSERELRRRIDRAQGAG